MDTRIATLLCTPLLATGLAAQRAGGTSEPAGPPPPPPRQLAPPPVPEGNPITPEKVLLGKALFWEEQLSSTRTMACGTCHFPSAGGGDARAALMGPGTMHPGFDEVFGTEDDVVGSQGVIRNGPRGSYLSDPTFGVEPQVTRRKAPPVINAAYAPFLFWDGRAETTFRDPLSGEVVLRHAAALESQVSEPPVSEVEMGHVENDWADVVARIQNAIPLALASDLPAALDDFIAEASYPELFARAFGTPEVTPARIAMAIATYERVLVSDQAKVDRFPEGFSALELQGATVFDRQGRCSLCHTTKIFTDHEFRNIGLRPSFEDRGLGAVTGRPGDDGKFRTPSLRNVELRAPYFHHGGAATLEEVVEFYDRGGDFHENQDPDIVPLGLTDREKAALVAYLKTLTDERVRRELPPFDRPTLYTESRHVPVTFGTGTAARGGSVPTAIVIEPPYVHSPSMTLGVKGGSEGARAFLVLDVRRVPDGVPLRGVTVYLARTPAAMTFHAGTLSGSGMGNGFTSLPMPLRLDPSLIGHSLFGQWCLIDGRTISASDAFELTFFGGVRPPRPPSAATPRR